MNQQMCSLRHWFVIFFVLCGCCCCSPVQASAVAVDEPAGTDVGILLCRNKLARCRTKGVTMNTEDWLDALKGVEESNAVLLREVIETSRKVDFHPMLHEMRSITASQQRFILIRGLQALLSIIRNSGALTVAALLRIVLQLQQLFQFVNDQFIIFVLQSFLQIMVALAGGPVVALTTIIQILATFLDSFTSLTRTYIMAPRSNAECFAESMACDFHTMVGEVVPLLIRGIGV